MNKLIKAALLSVLLFTSNSAMADYKATDMNVKYFCYHLSDNVLDMNKLIYSSEKGMAGFYFERAVKEAGNNDAVRFMLKSAVRLALHDASTNSAEVEMKELKRCLRILTPEAMKEINKLTYADDREKAAVHLIMKEIGE